MPKNHLLTRLGRKLRRRRQELQLSQEDLAEKGGLHRSYVGSIERGEKNITFLNLLTKNSRKLLQNPTNGASLIISLRKNYWRKEENQFNHKSRRN